jgi:hypothetical protein
MAGVRHSLKVGAGPKRLIKALERFGADGEKAISDVVRRVTLLSKEVIAERITVLNIVDTGFYRANWQAVMVSPTVGKLTTNTAYALVLEFGLDGSVTIAAHTRKTKSGGVANVRQHTRYVKRPGYGAAQDTAVKMRVKMIEEMEKAIRRLTEGLKK